MERRGQEETLFHRMNGESSGDICGQESWRKEELFSPEIKKSLSKRDHCSLSLNTEAWEALENSH